MPGAVLAPDDPLRLVTDALVVDCPTLRRYVKVNGTMIVRVEGVLYGFAESGKRWYYVMSTFLIDALKTQSWVVCLEEALRNSVQHHGYDNLERPVYQDNVSTISLRVIVNEGLTSQHPENASSNKRRRR